MSFISTNLSWLQCSPANITQSPAEEEYTPMRRALGSQEYKVGGPSDLAVSAHFPIKAQIKLGVASNRIDCQKREFDKFTQINLITAKWPMFHLCSCQPGKRTYPTWIRPKWTIFGVGMRGKWCCAAIVLRDPSCYTCAACLWCQRWFGKPQNRGCAVPRIRLLIQYVLWPPTFSPTLGKQTKKRFDKRIR